MTESSVVQDGSGRLVLKIKDDQGEPESFNNPASADFALCGAFQEKITIDMNRSDTRGAYRLGTILLAAQINPGTGFTGTLLALEVLVIGYIGTAPTTIKSTIFGAFLNQDVVGLDDTTSYDSIGIQGRQLVDGLPSSTGPIGALTLQVSGRFTR